MQEFKSNQSNPYAKRPDPRLRRVNAPVDQPAQQQSISPSDDLPSADETPTQSFQNFEPAPEEYTLDSNYENPTHSDPLEPGGWEWGEPEQPKNTAREQYQPIQHVAEPTYVQPQFVHVKPKSSVGLTVAAVLAGFLLLGSSVGGMYFWQNKQVSGLESELAEAKQKSSEFKNELIDYRNGTNPLVAGTTSEDPTPTSAGSTNQLYNGQINATAQEIVFTSIPNASIGELLAAAWVEVGTDPLDLKDKTDEQGGDLSNGISIAVSTENFEPGGVYFYQIKARDVSGTEYSSGIGVFQLPDTSGL